MEIQELWEKMQGEFTKVNTRLDNVETKVDNMDERLGNVETKVDSMDERLGNVETKVDNMDERLGNVETKVDNMDGRLGNVEVGVKEVRYDNKIIKEEVMRINEKLDVIQNSNLANILRKQNQIIEELRAATEIV